MYSILCPLCNYARSVTTFASVRECVLRGHLAAYLRMGNWCQGCGSRFRRVLLLVRLGNRCQNKRNIFPFNFFCSASRIRTSIYNFDARKHQLSFAGFVFETKFHGDWRRNYADSCNHNLHRQYYRSVANITISFKCFNGSYRRIWNQSIAHVPS